MRPLSIQGAADPFKQNQDADFACLLRALKIDTTKMICALHLTFIFKHSDRGMFDTDIFHRFQL